MPKDFAPRTATVARKTGETDIQLTLSLDGGPYENRTGVGFLDHMLDLFARHGGFGLTVHAKGDLHVDDHHTVEDVGICLGQALGVALGDKAYIGRYGHAMIPMDEALALAAVDLSGRAFLVFDAAFDRETVGDLSTELVQHFWWSVAEHAKMTLHLRLLSGANDHHRIEAIFKAAGRALRAAVARNPDGDAVPSTKETF